LGISEASGNARTSLYWEGLKAAVGFLGSLPEEEVAWIASFPFKLLKD